MFRKMFTGIICLAVTFTMMPAVSFGLSEADQDVLRLQEESLQFQEELTVDGKFKDMGDEYVMEDVSKYKDNMKIYGFYIGPSDEKYKGKYGDAYLIESNGRYLLVDCGHKNAADKLVSCIKSVMKKNKKLDIYVSHVHGDHTGGLEKVMNSFDVGTVFLPDIELCENYVTPKADKSIDEIYIEHVAICKAGGADKIVYLRPDSSVRPSEPRAENTYSQFNVGGAVCTVLGPLGTYKPEDFVDYVKELKGNCGTKESHCLNNTSLCTMVECGGASFLATGDVEKHEEAKLVETYGDALDSDIMKLPHHGLRTSCSPAFAAKVTPMWSFQQNHGYNPEKMYKSALNTAKAYGYNYGVADENHSIIFNVQKGYVRVNIDTNDNNRLDDKYLMGWVETGENKQYYNLLGYIETGAQWIKGDLYYLSETSGFTSPGTHEIDGEEVNFDGEGKLMESEKPSKVNLTGATAAGKRKVKLSWESAEKADAYQIYRARSKDGLYVKVATRYYDATSYTGIALKKGKTYYYKVRAVRYIAYGKACGQFSDVKSVKVK